NSDGVLDGPFAQGTNRVGIWLNGGSFTGDITNSGAINVEGNDSAGILINGLLTGNLVSSGPINLTGDNVSNIAITGGVGNGVVGNITTTGNYTAHGQNATGLLLDAPVTGSVSVNGVW